MWIYVGCVRDLECKLRDVLPFADDTEGTCGFSLCNLNQWAASVELGDNSEFDDHGRQRVIPVESPTSVVFGQTMPAVVANLQCLCLNKELTWMW